MTKLQPRLPWITSHICSCLQKDAFLIFMCSFPVLDWRMVVYTLMDQLSWHLHEWRKKTKTKQELSGEQMTQMLLIECEFSWFTVGPVPSLDVSVSLLFLYSGENDPRPRRWHASSYSGPSVFQHLLHATDPLRWGEVKILTVILPQPGVLLHNCRYFNHMSAANASVHFFPHRQLLLKLQNLDISPCVRVDPVYILSACTPLSAM